MSSNGQTWAQQLLVSRSQLLSDISLFLLPLWFLYLWGSPTAQVSAADVALPGICHTTFGSFCEDKFKLYQ